jgi:hypothetical protein
MEYKIFALPLHKRHEDDDFDSTYRDVYFEVPPQMTELAELLVEEPVDNPARWVEALSRIERGELPPETEAALTGLVTRLNEAMESGGGVVEV